MPDTPPDHVEGTGTVALGQTLAFRVSGTGMLEELQGPPGTSAGSAD
jgi:hypothetical protein